MVFKITNTFNILNGNSGQKSADAVSQEKFFNGFNESSNSESEISMIKDIPDKKIQEKENRNKYLKTQKSSKYTVQQGDNPAKIANKFGVETRWLLACNGLLNDTTLSIGDVLVIPEVCVPKNIKNINDVAGALGVSKNFIKNLKKLEDGFDNPNKFHTVVYDDASNLTGANNLKNFKGVPTIGVGHVYKKGDKCPISNAEVLDLFAKDLLKMEQNLWSIFGKDKYDNFPTQVKEALLDMVFNKGTDIILQNKDLVYRLKNGKYEAAINCFTNVKNIAGKELSGLCLRRLFEISVAGKFDKGQYKESNLKTAQDLYNKGVALLKKEYGNKYVNVLVGYNATVKEYFGDKIKTVSK